eukprot:s2676_g6.t1
MAQRKVLFPLLLLALAFAWTQRHAFLNVTAARGLSRHAAVGSSAERARTAVALSARGGESEADEETIDVGGFSALVVGLALLPFAGYALSAAVSVISGASFELGPFGLQLTSIFVTVGLPGFASVKRLGLQYLE